MEKSDIKKKQITIKKVDRMLTKAGKPYKLIHDEDDDRYSSWPNIDGYDEMVKGADGVLEFYEEVTDDNKRYRRITSFDAVAPQAKLPLAEVEEDFEGKDRLIIVLKSISSELSKLIAELES